MAILESELGRQVQLWAGENGHLCFRYNTGMVQDAKTGRYIDFGPPKGHSDYILFTKNGLTVFIETKIKYNKQSKEQIDFMNAVQSRGFIYIVVKKLSDLTANYVISHG